MATENANQNKNSSNKNVFGVTHEEYIYEDDSCYVFDELINPQAPVHYVVVPKKHIPTLEDATVEDEKLLGHLLIVAKNVAISRGLHKSGYHVVVDEAYRRGQPGGGRLRSVHVFGRALQHMIWPTGPGARL